MEKKKKGDDSPSNPVGRPSDYRSEFCAQLVDHMSQGYSFQSFAAIAWVTCKTLYNWAETYPEFAEAKELGFDLCRYKWEKLGVDHVVNTSEYDGENKISTSKSLNANVWTFNMINRFNWRSRQPDEADKVIIENKITGMSVAEIEARIAELTKKPKGESPT